MISRRRVSTMVSIAVMSLLIGTMFSVITMARDDRGNPFRKIWEAIYDLQARVTFLEESVDTKTWHFVTSFTLSSEETVSQLFFVQGEKWRFSWGAEEGTTLVTGFILHVIDENEDVIEIFDAFVYTHEDVYSGLRYMSHGKGGYYMYCSYLGSLEHRISFTIESYH